MVGVLAQRAPGFVVAGVVATAAVVGFVGGGVLGSLSGLGADGDDGDQLVQPVESQTRLIDVAVAAASCERPPAVDSAFNQVEYKAEFAVNGDPDTAWQCRGDGEGETLELALGGPVSVVSVGLIPGYAKVDPHDGTEWYPLNRRLTEVRWHFDGDLTVTQQLDPDPALRELQVLELDEPVEATTVTLEIVSSAPGSSEAHANIAISDLQVAIVG